MGSVSQLGYLQRRPGQAVNGFPRWPLLGAGFLLLFAISAVVFGQATGIGTLKNPTGSPNAVRDIIILQDKVSGDVTVSDALTGQELSRFGAQEGGFVRGSLRAFNRMRLVSGVAETQPYRLIRWTGGAVTLSDTGTGERFYLDAFGRDNAAAFAKFLNNHGGVEK